ncbi:MAG: DUF2254 domain-containing protein, partial [Pseudomonadaceae bacterium]
RIQVAALPGSFIAAGRPLAFIRFDSDTTDCNLEQVIEAFEIGRERLFENDPRFGLVVLSEIAGRALSPGVNDPGSAITVIGVQVRLLSLWAARPKEVPEPRCNRIEVPELCVMDMFDDAFTAIARDGAGSIEVMVRLQKALHALSQASHPDMVDAAKKHARLALTRAESKLELPEERALVRELAGFAR